MKKILALAVIVAACSTSVFAQNIGNLYGEAAYSMVSSKDTSKDSLGTFKPTAGRFTLGTTLTENVAVEGFLTQGFSDSSIVSGVVNVNLKMNENSLTQKLVKTNQQLEICLKKEEMEKPRFQERK